MDSNKRIGLNAGRFIGGCFVKYKAATIMFLAFAVISAVSDILRAYGAGDNKDISFVFSAGAVIDILFVIFIIHSFVQGIKNKKSGFFEIPVMIFEGLASLYYLVFGYIRLHRTAAAEGFFQKLLGWSYTAYTALLLISCVLVMSFLKSQLISRQSGSLVGFIADLGIVSSILLPVSYVLCFIFTGYTNDSHILYTLPDFLRIAAAPVLLIGYWIILHTAAAKSQEIYEKYYEKLLSITPVGDEEYNRPLRDADFYSEGFYGSKKSEKKTEPETPKTDVFDVFEEEKSASVDEIIAENTEQDEKEEEIPKKNIEFKTDDCFEEETDKIEESPWFLSSTYDEDDGNPENTDGFEDEIPKTDEKAEKNGKNKSVLQAVGLGALFMLFCIINFIPGLIKLVMRLAYISVKWFGIIRYKLVYTLLLIIYDGKIHYKKLNALKGSKQRCFDLCEKIEEASGKIKIIKFKHNNKTTKDENTEE